LRPPSRSGEPEPLGATLNARSSEIKGLAIGAVLAAAVGALVVWASVSVAWLPVVVALAASAAAVLLVDRSATLLPLALRPAPVVFVSVAFGAVASSSLPSDDVAAYALLLGFELVGFALGILLLPDISTAGIRPREVDAEKLIRWSKVIWWLGLLAAFGFFATHGIPALSGNVESGRVEQAASGSGYFRLIAYMAGPASLMIFAADGFRSWKYVAGALIMIVALGDRSPLLYLLIPLGVTFSIAGRRRFGSIQILGVGLAVLVIIAGLGAYRIVSQEDFRSYPEYRKDIAEKNYLAIAETSLTHYAEVVPANAVLTKRLVDKGLIHYQYGATYATLAISALPGRQLSPDLLIKEVTHKRFIGGGTPPTLSGEGYMNAGYIGVVVSALVLMLLVRYWASALPRSLRGLASPSGRVTSMVYGYVLAWALGAQVAGLAGASSVPLAGFLLLVVLRHMCSEKTARAV
jgi:hypothetical protein